MNVPAHRRYKPSGFEWLGDVPEHWTPSRVKRGYSVQLGKMLQPDPDGPNDEETPYLKAQHVQWAGVRVSALPVMWATRGEWQKYGVAHGDLLVCEGGEVGRAALVDSHPPRTIIQNALHRVRGQRGHDVGFLRYVLWHATSQEWFDVLCNRSTIAHFTGEKFGALGLALPDFAEQQTISAFLDRETARLDRLVAKKRELIERLNEKRTVLISRTVMRGLPPAAARAAGLSENPPLKPSGVDWLGDIPVHWDVVPYKRVCTRVDVGIAEAATHAYCDDGVPLIRSTNVKPNRLDTSDILRIEPWFAEKNRSKTLRAGDLVTVRTGYPGTTAIVPADLDGAQCFTLVLSSPKRDTHGPYFSWVMNSAQGASYFGMEGWGTAQTNISVPIVQFMPVPRPPRPEQKAIAEFLSVETTKVDSLLAKVETAIERLQEYRTALITAAVTGKIDVRGKTNP